MINSGIIASRHRVPTEYYLDLDYTISNDRIRVSPAFVGASFVFECRAIVDANNGITIQNRGNALAGGQNNNGFALYANDGVLFGQSRFVIFRDAAYNFTDIPTDSNFRDFRFDYKNEDPNELRVYINDVLHDSVVVSGNIVDTVVPLNINAILDSAGNIITSTHSAKYQNFNFEGSFFSCNEGEGFSLNSNDMIYTGLGVTANAGGLTYWDSNVWQLITP